jgi:ATP-dependent Lon protease
VSDFLLVPLEDSVVFPNMTVTLAVETGDEQRVLLVPVHEGEYARVGTVAEVGGVLRLPGGGHAVTLNGLHRGIAGAASTGADGRLRVEVEEQPDENPPRVKTAELEREYRAIVEEILELREADPRVRDFLRAVSDAGALA